MLVGAQQPQWQYRTLDLAEFPHKMSNIDVLNAAGGEGWELVAIAVNGVAILKRPVVEDAPPRRRRGNLPSMIEPRR